MSKSLIIKELRETWWLGLIAMILMGLIVWNAMGYQVDIHNFSMQRRVDFVGRSHTLLPFIERGFSSTVALTCGGVGLILGFWQTLTESIQGTWLFLLHRPANRRRIILSKLGVGVAVTAMSTALPLLVYLVWAMTPETHASPFELWMASETFVAWLAGPTLFLAAFLCGVREARWYASRLLPLVPVLFVWVLTSMDALPLIAPFGWIALPIGVVLVGAILFSSRHRDFV